jgi:Flp pilus assembly protein TadD
MARALEATHKTPADELRDLLTKGEKLVVNPGDGADGTIELLQLLDRVDELWPRLTAAGVDLRPESGRLEALHAATGKQAAILLRRLRDAGGIESIRSRIRPGEDAGWWWHLDTLVRERRMRSLRTAAIVTAVVLLVGAALVFILNRLFPVDPNVSAALTLTNRGQMQAAEQGDYAGALAQFQAAAELTPEDPEVWLWIGMLQDRLGRPAEAKDAFERARGLLSSDGDFYVQRAAAYLGAQWIGPARQDLEAALAIDPENPQAYYYLATVYELSGDVANALQSLERASDLADKRGVPELTAMARYRMGMLLQAVAAPGVGTPGLQPTATPAN